MTTGRKTRQIEAREKVGVGVFKRAQKMFPIIHPGARRKHLFIYFLNQGKDL